MFDYLKGYIFDRTASLRWPCNSFFSVDKEALIKAEERLGYDFPEQLKLFYRKIGHGSLQVPHHTSKSNNISDCNTIHDPDTLADIVLLGGDGDACPYISPYTWEYLEPGYLPFFEIGDGTRFLVMKALSDNPNAVWNTFGDIKIEDSLERLIWRMYYEDTAYYDDIIEAHYAALET